MKEKSFLQALHNVDDEIWFSQLSNPSMKGETMGIRFIEEDYHKRKNYLHNCLVMGKKDKPQTTMDLCRKYVHLSRTLGLGKSFC